MDARSRAVFLALLLVQAAHSIEEYVTKLYDVFAPARFVSGLVSDDLARGFLVLNAGLVAFGIWCYAAPVRSNWPSARGIAWFWVVLETGNGITHLSLAAVRGSYFPGVATAPLLLVAAITLGSAIAARGAAQSFKRPDR